MKNKLSLFLSSLLAGILLLTGTARAAGDCTTIDVLAVFDQSSLESLRTSVQYNGVTCAPMGVEETAEMAVAHLNQVLINSGIGDKVQFRSVGLITTNYRTRAGKNGETAGNDLGAMLEGRVPGLVEGREQHKADLVIMFTAYDYTGSGTGGVSLPTDLQSAIICTGSASIPMDGFAATFHVASIRANDSVFSHEVGHLMGAGHADYQLAQCGPQATTCASGALSEDKKYCSLMSYPTWNDVNDDDAPFKNANRAEWLPVFSSPRAISLTNPTTGKKIKTTLGNQNTQNNAAVVLSSAPYVAAYRINGNETPNNDSWENATPISKLMPGKDTVYRSMRGRFYRWLGESGIQQLVINILKEEGRDPRSLTEDDLRQYIKKIWENREIIAQEIIQDKSITQKCLGASFWPELEESEGSNYYISTVYGSNTGATKQHGEPTLPGGCGSTVWYRLTAPEDGDLEIGIRKAFTTKGFTPVLGVFYGDQIGKLTQLEQQEVQNEKSSYFLKNIKVNVQKGARLYIAVDSQKQEQARFNLLAKLHPGQYNGKPLPTGGDDDDADNDTTPQPASGNNSTILIILCLGLGVVCIVLTAMLIYQMKSMAKDTPDAGSAYAPAPAPMYPPAPNPGYTPVPNDTPYSFPAGENIPGPAPIPGYDAPAPIPGVEIEPPTAPRPLIVLSGILSDGRKVKYKITVAEISRHHNFYIGRDPKKSHFCIDDMSISGRHAVFKMRSEENRKVLLLGDAGSRNGTSVNGNRMTGGLCAKIHNNAKIQLGQCVFTLTTKTE